MTDETTLSNPMVEFFKLFAAAVKDLPAKFIKDQKATIKANDPKNNRVYTFMALSTLLQTVNPVFLNHDLLLVQEINHVLDDNGKGILRDCVETHVIAYNLGIDKVMGQYSYIVNPNPQATGSAVTYARRYSIYCMLGIFPEKDDDGAKARDVDKNGEDTQQAVQQQPKPESGGITREASQQLAQLARQAGVNLLQAASQTTGRKITRLRELTPLEGQTLTRQISNYIEANHAQQAQS